MTNLLKECVNVNFTDEGIKLTQKCSNDDILIRLLIDKRDSIKDNDELQQRIHELILAIR